MNRRTLLQLSLCAVVKSDAPPHVVYFPPGVYRSGDVVLPQALVDACQAAAADITRLAEQMAAVARTWALDYDALGPQPGHVLRISRAT